MDLNYSLCNYWMYLYVTKRIPFTVCQNTLHGFYGVIESPNFPYTYEKNANCSWTIDAPIGNKINITFSHFDLEGTSYTNSCDYDYLEVYEGYDGGPHTQLGKFCDSNVLPPKIHSSDHQVHLKFVTDGFLNSNGFRLEWVVDGCGGHLTRPFDSFTSPGYPSAYPSNVDCEWLIEVDFSHSIELTLHDVGILRWTFSDSQWRIKISRVFNLILLDKHREADGLLLRQGSNFQRQGWERTEISRNLLLA